VINQKKPDFPAVGVDLTNVPNPQQLKWLYITSVLLLPLLTAAGVAGLMYWLG